MGNGYFFKYILNLLHEIYLLYIVSYKLQCNLKILWQMTIFFVSFSGKMDGIWNTQHNLEILVLSIFEKKSLNGSTNPKSNHWNSITFQWRRKKGMERYFPLLCNIPYGTILRFFVDNQKKNSMNIKKFSKIDEQFVKIFWNFVVRKSLPK